MTWGEALQEINYLAPVAATVAALALGALWYGKMGFMKQWMKLTGLTKKDVEKSDGMPTLFTAMAVFYFLAALMLAGLMELAGQTGGGAGALTGGIVGLAAGFGPLVVTYGYARRTFELALIDGGYILVAFILMGSVVGMW